MRILLIPQPGLLVPCPVTKKPLPAEGKTVELNSYWHRRIADGSVTQATDAPARDEKPTQAKPLKPLSQEK